MRKLTLYLILIVNPGLLLSQNYRTALITDFEHWGVPKEVYHGVPDYFSNDDIWVHQIKSAINDFLIRKYSVDQVNFLNSKIRIRDDRRDSGKTYYMDTVDRNEADLFVLVSSYVTYSQFLSIEVEIEDQRENRLWKRKSRIRLLPQMNPTGIETHIDISQTDFKTLYHRLLETAFFENKRKQNLGEYKVSRTRDTEYDKFLDQAISCIVSVSGNISDTYQVDFLNEEREDFHIEVKEGNTLEINSDGFRGKRQEKKGKVSIKSDFLEEGWIIQYHLKEKKKHLLPDILEYWETAEFNIDILTDDKKPLGKVPLMKNDTMIVELGQSITTIDWTHYGTILEVYQEGKLKTLIQTPKSTDEKRFIKFFFKEGILDQELAEFVSIFLLHQKLKSL